MRRTYEVEGASMYHENYLLGSMGRSHHADQASDS